MEYANIHMKWVKSIMFFKVSYTGTAKWFNIEITVPWKSLHYFINRQNFWSSQFLILQN